MPPAAPPKFPSPLTTTLSPTPRASKYSPDHGFESDNLTLKDGAAAPTQAVLLNRKASPQYYITLTITDPAAFTYTTTILLGDNYPGPSPTDPVQQSASTQTLTAAAPKSPGLSSGSVAGIIIGVLGGFAVLAGVFYVWMLRARQWKTTHKKRKRKKKKKKKTTWFTFKFRFKKSKKRRRSRRSSTSTGGTGPPPPPPPGPGPPPPPPGDAGPPPPPPPAE